MMLQRPFLSLGLILLWLMLSGFSIGNLVLGVLIAGVAVLASAPLELPRSRFPRLWPLIRLAGRVSVDIVRSNIGVARVVLAGPDYADRHSGFLDIHIDLKDPNALALLAIILTGTPGTAWLDYRADEGEDALGGRLLLHILDLDDPEYWREVVCNRYVRLLKEAFE
ncbi:MAG: Na+/H+ antiporter subunit E [Paracoccus sp. (in: a-proteobacteria)]|uniref:Na+/H+ antiporter subunit E n=1 Tax=Paracoccus sp. TaxID=267 RepID=UPI0026DF4220|nr:Na+/H+ antiporter subunit E [Paracoccus sp. (in: a-proteobacteria)]MDO5620295.1 Na+/H+ antiporter subunit E [Paracoccus sp. (in: a-proteobacteria)]